MYLGVIVALVAGWGSRRWASARLALAWIGVAAVLNYAQWILEHSFGVSCFGPERFALGVSFGAGLGLMLARSVDDARLRLLPRLVLGLGLVSVLLGRGSLANLTLALAAATTLITAVSLVARTDRNESRDANP